jgi:hypothetical protein
MEWSCGQAVQHLLCNYEAMCSNPSTTKKERQRQRDMRPRIKREVRIIVLWGRAWGRGHVGGSHTVHSSQHSAPTTTLAQRKVLELQKESQDGSHCSKNTENNSEGQRGHVGRAHLHISSWAELESLLLLLSCCTDVVWGPTQAFGHGPWWKHMRSAEFLEKLPTRDHSTMHRSAIVWMVAFEATWSHDLSNVNRSVRARSCDI